MPILNSHIDELIVKHLKGTISADEKVALSSWVSSSAENKELFENLNNEQWTSAQLQLFQRYDEEMGWRKFKEAMPETEPIVIKKYNWSRLAVAASVIGLLFLAAFWLLNTERKNETVQPGTAVATDVEAPKGTKARITLVDGQSVFLDSISSGILANQGDVNVMKTDDGQIIYNGSGTELQYNTLSNPRGSSVASITLSDGTKVWLNSGSTLTYPVAFVANDRNVKVTGEAYFEVAKNPAKKFIVSSDDIATEVLGTHFNINNYSDEKNARITLLEGSVRVTKASRVKMLKPGQQLVANDAMDIVASVDTDEVMAWKDGKFQFGEKADIPSIMRQIARWYDVEVEYRGTVAGHIGGSMARTENLSQVLKMLEKTGVVTFRIENKKLIVMP